MVNTRRIFLLEKRVDELARRLDTMDAQIRARLKEEAEERNLTYEKWPIRRSD